MLITYTGLWVIAPSCKSCTVCVSVYTCSFIQCIYLYWCYGFMLPFTMFTRIQLIDTAFLTNFNDPHQSYCQILTCQYIGTELEPIYSQKSSSVPVVVVSAGYITSMQLLLYSCLICSEVARRHFRTTLFLYCVYYRPFKSVCFTFI